VSQTLSVIKARVVSYAKAGPAGAETVLTTECSYFEQYVAAAYSTVSQEFLVTWPRFGWGASPIRTDNAGAPKGDMFTISAAGQNEGHPAVAYNPVSNQFLVTYKGWGSF